MSYVALYRKWRPTDFANLVGQEHISKTLANAIVMGKIAHAYLFSGPRGTGKTSTAKILAKALNCENGPTPSPCNICENCAKINSGSSMDVYEIDAASNRGIDEIRDLRETVKFAPVNGRYKVYIIDEVHMLTTEAFNALLKTLEEPPAHVVFILATTEPHKIPATIHSRCQRYDFKRITAADIKKHLAYIVDRMELVADDAALLLIAQYADGGLRDALSVLDQCSAMDGEPVTAAKVRQILGLIGDEWIWRLVGQLAGKDGRGVLESLAALLNDGKDVRQILNELAVYLRDVMVYQAAGTLRDTVCYPEQEEALREHAAAFSYAQLSAMIAGLQRALNDAKWAAQPRIIAEVNLLAFCQTEVGSGDVAALQQRIVKLEDKITLLEKRGATASIIAPQESPRRAAGAVSPPPVRPEPMTASTRSAPVKDVVTKSPVDDDSAAVWRQVLKVLLDTGKRSIYACVSQSEVYEMEERLLTIGFKSAFPKERTEKQDYRAALEELLQQITGRPLGLRCVLVNDRPPCNHNSDNQNAVRQSDSNLPQPHVVEEALKVFGGKIERLDG